MNTHSTGTRAYVEHVAIWVRDIQWHIRFFREVLGMTMRELQGDPEQPQQYWTLGGLQFMQRDSYEGDDGRLGHIGIMCTDLEAAIAATKARGGTEAPQGRNWLRLPDGLVIELIQATPGSVEQALAVKARP